MGIEKTLKNYSGMLSRIVASYEADPVLQQEVMQEVSLAIWRALPKFRGEGSEKAFVARVAQNICLTHVRKEVRRPRSVELDYDMKSDVASPEEQTEKEQQREKLLHAVRGLPLPMKQVVTLALEGFSHKEIGAALAISENNAMVRFSRAKGELKKALEAQNQPEGIG
ncbi:RNA polymerase sigma factor [Kordiimonas sp. SCSIO 12610]|uniref:RNA polymerase sigma factor n=1 Tax=Kordiimonas sp. SCSIO 12610 TaxID=2829597 RepID=UPI00210EE291|nr:sigma-70 family RNA polymerase sigma factor [Kordiimonas sp. SCSIO 12610]UTW56735.1 sigma-70 family RNA polymerase sigma factor [Kordiimonas sp. SCSIO 12610]